MSAMTIFYQECPICGRNLRIPAKHFGRLMSCTHCEGEFLAGKEELAEPAGGRESDLGACSTELVRPGVFAQTQLGEV